MKLQPKMSSPPNGDGNHGGWYFDQGIVGGVGDQCAGLLRHGGLPGVASARQIFQRGVGAATTTCRNPQLTLQVTHGGSPVRYSGLYLTLGNGVTDANEHENNYYPDADKNQSHLTNNYATNVYQRGFWRRHTLHSLSKRAICFGRFSCCRRKIRAPRAPCAIWPALCRPPRGTWRPYVAQSPHPVRPGAGRSDCRTAVSCRIPRPRA